MNMLVMKETKAQGQEQLAKEKEELKLITTYLMCC
jgi:hypothetical protein